MCVCPGGAQNVILGVLEDVPGAYAGEKNWPGVRPVFHKDAGRTWSAYSTDCTEPDECAETAKQFPPGQHWTIGFDGKRMGEVSTEVKDEADLGSHIGLQKVKDAAVPWVGKRSSQFAGFLAQPVYRPLVANTQPYVDDPDLWKPAQVPPAVLTQLRKRFRERYPKLCHGGEGRSAKPWPYPDDAVAVEKAYRSKDDRYVARLQVAGAMACGSESANFGPDAPWFTAGPQGETKYLGSGLWLVDAGDYDHDGHSELVFAIDRYNQGGYVLFYDGLEKQATFEYSYH